MVNNRTVMISNVIWFSSIVLGKHTSIRKIKYSIAFYIEFGNRSNFSLE